MSVYEQAVGSKEAPTSDVESDALYHVRLIHSWPPALKSRSLDKTLVSSFYGLQLELRGIAKTLADRRTPITLINDGQTLANIADSMKPASAPLQFGSKSPPTAALLASLEAITGPFQVVITGKVPAPALATDEESTAALQQMNSVQVDNSLLEINGERFLLNANSTGADIYRRLWLVASRASLAAPYELTFRRHNLVQASVKIVPFAKRKDVQDAQVAQVPKLAAQEAALPLDIRRKKLFLVQQLDFEREHYLVAYVSGPLQELHTKVMGDGQWQAYEFGKTLWYFHAPTGRLRAQHPMRSHPQARELIERVQQQVQQAVRRLQRRTRSCQRRQRLMSIIQAQIQRRDEEKRKEQQLLQAVRRVQLRMRSKQRRRRFVATVEEEKRQQEELRRELQRAEDRKREEQRAEEILQLESMKHERRRLQQELDELKLEVQRSRELQEKRVIVQSETQTSGRRDEESAIELLRKDEQQRVQERLEKLELELSVRKLASAATESQTQTRSPGDDSDDLQRGEQQRSQQRIQELELKLHTQSSKVVMESVTQTTSQGTLCDKGVDTGDDLEWQRHLTLLRVAVNNKKKKASPKSKRTQTEFADGEKTLLVSSFLRAPQNAVPFSSVTRKFTGEWNGFPSWQQCSGFGTSNNSSNSSSTNSLLTLKSSLGQLDELDTMLPPTRTLESFFSPEVTMTHDQPPPPFVEHPWRQDSSFLPLKSSRKLVEVTPVHQPLTVQVPEYQEPIRPIRTTGNSSPLVQNSPASSPTRLPYITRRRKQFS